MAVAPVLCASLTLSRISREIRCLRSISRVDPAGGMPPSPNQVSAHATASAARLSGDPSNVAAAHDTG
jgi:hypothetical protein